MIFTKSSCAFVQIIFFNFARVVFSLNGIVCLLLNFLCIFVYFSRDCCELSAPVQCVLRTECDVKFCSFRHLVFCLQTCLESCLYGHQSFSVASLSLYRSLPETLRDMPVGSFN